MLKLYINRAVLLSEWLTRFHRKQPTYEKKLNSNSLVSVHKEVHTNFVKTDLCQNKMTNK